MVGQKERKLKKLQIKQHETFRTMSRLATSFVLGYHGCDKSVGQDAITGKTDLIKSDKDYDWLGPGAYFWESDPKRALEWAQDKVRKGHYKPNSQIDG
jgi:hypothetical protein